MSFIQSGNETLLLKIQMFIIAINGKIEKGDRRISSVILFRSPNQNTLAIFAILIQFTLVDAAQGLTRYYNCVTRDANNQGSLSLADVESCYDKVFKGTQNVDDEGKPFS